jgi:hypothetical protein
MDSTAPEYFHQPIGKIGILDPILDVLKDAKQYRTLMLLGLMSKHHAAIVRPLLKSIKERVVLDLDELGFRDVSKDGNVEYMNHPGSKALFANDSSHPCSQDLAVHARQPVTDRHGPGR